MDLIPKIILYRLVRAAIHLKITEILKSGTKPINTMMNKYYDEERERKILNYINDMAIPR